MSKQLSFVADEETVALIEDLKRELGATTTAGVFRKALTLARIAAERAKDSDHVVTIKGQKEADDEAVNIMLKA
jgi:hypothetical protein